MSKEKKMKLRFEALIFLLTLFSCSTPEISTQNQTSIESKRMPSSINHESDCLSSVNNFVKVINAPATKKITPIASSHEKILNQEEALKILTAKPDVGTIKIEVGAAHLPMCDDCLQVDRYRSVMDYKLAEAKAKGIPADQVVPPKENFIFAVETRNGVVADARELPFADGSVSIMVTKHLPWANHEKPEVREFIAQVFKEYKRVLSKDGSSLILVNGNNDPAKLLGGHREIALELGFEVTPIRGEDFSGYLLKHVRD